MYRLLAALALHAAVVVFAAGRAGAATSRFDAGTEGWSALGDVAGPVQWLAADGNPGGYITVEIRAEFQTGADVGDLDNAAYVPEPSLASLALVSSTILLGIRVRRGCRPR